MPYQTSEYTPPQLPEVREIKTFHDVTVAIGRIMDYLQRMQANNVLYFQHLISNMNHAATTQGEDIASAPAITVTKFMHVVTGTGTIQTINAPLHFVGQLMLFSQDGFFLASGGNISLITTPNAIRPGAHIMLTYVPSKQTWFADTCRIQTTATTLRVGGHNVVTE